MRDVDQPTLQPRGLSRGHFRQVGVRGFGDGRNSYAYSCAWFKDHLYIGTNRNVFVINAKRVPIKLPFEIFPVPLPDDDAEIDLCGQIWRYHPPTGVWERVYRSPLVQGLNGQPGPLAYGFRNMAVFQGKSDSAPVIYTIPNCGSFNPGPVLLRSADGVHFEVASEPNLGMGNNNVISYRGAIPFKDRLFITPAGARGGQTCAGYNMSVLCSDDPTRGGWAVSNPGGFGDPTNHGIFDIGTCGDYLYAGTINVREGFQIWKSTAEGPPPHRWTLVVDRGADRGPFNQAIAGFAEFKGNLYLGTGIQCGGYDRYNNIGPAAPEILRVYPDDTWDLIMGEPRMTRVGLKVPSSGLGPGFNNPSNGYIWRISTHEGGLYAGSYDAIAVAPFCDRAGWSPTTQRLLDPVTLENYLKVIGGCELWRTTDGDHWAPITRNGFDSPFNWGIRSLKSTPAGLFVGTVNPFGPHVATRGPGGWRYEPNPRGGTEIWHGSWDHAGASLAGLEGPSRLVPELWSDSDGSIPYSRLLSLGPQVDSLPELTPDELDEGWARRELLQALNRATCPDGLLAAHDRYEVQDVETERNEPWINAPERYLAGCPKDLLGLTDDVEGELRAYFGGELRCVGFWSEDSWTPRRACEQLLTELLELVPSSRSAAPGTSILALGIGGDALGEHLRVLRPSAAVSVLNGDLAAWSGVPANRASGAGLKKALAPLIKARRAVDVVVWVEGPGLNGRSQALREVGRVLKPGGWLVAADVVGSPSDDEKQLLRNLDKAALLNAYERDLKQAGLVDVRVLPVQRDTWERFYRHSRLYFATKLLFRQIEREQHDRILGALPCGELVVADYVLVAARKPET